jgi:RNA polymerase sigma-70 factor (TIGR02960 family)
VFRTVGCPSTRRTPLRFCVLRPGLLCSIATVALISLLVLPAGSAAGTITEPSSELAKQMRSLAASAAAKKSQRVLDDAILSPQVGRALRTSLSLKTFAGQMTPFEKSLVSAGALVRRELQVHIYRIVGSAQDAEDLLQETFLAAWRGLGQFEERASVRAWLYRIATNRSLDALRSSRRRPEEERMPQMPEPTRWNEPTWLEPYADVLLDGVADEAPGPEARYETKEAIALAFVVGLQHLPPQQRAVLVLRDVLGYRAGEVAEMLQTSEASVNNLLRRARAAFETRLPATGRERAPLPNSKLERDIVGRFAETVENGDIDGMVALLTEDAWVTMPPLPHAYQGHDAIGAFLRGSAERSGAPMRLVPTRANTQPAFGCYLPVPDTDIARAYALFVLTLEDDHISAITWFADSSVFPQFGLPRMLPGSAR